MIPGAISFKGFFGDQIINPKKMRLTAPAASEPIGTCIYCGAANANTKEHTIPRSLKSDRMLRDASCKQCAGITSRFEQEVVRGHFDELREMLRFPASKKTKRRRWKGTKQIEVREPAMVDDVLQEVPRQVTVPLGTTPAAVVFPCHGYVPTKLSKRAELKGSLDPAFIHRQLFPSLRPGAPRSWADRSTNFNHLAFDRFIAKIALCEFLLQHDMDFRSDELSKFIISPDTNAGISLGSRYVGSIKPHGNTELIHLVDFRTYVRPSSYQYPPFSTVALVKPFDVLNPPLYLVWLEDRIAPRPNLKKVHQIDLDQDYLSGEFFDKTPAWHLAFDE